MKAQTVRGKIKYNAN